MGSRLDLRQPQPRPKPTRAVIASLAPSRGEVRVDAEGAGDHVVVAFVDDGWEVELKHPNDGRAVHHDFLHLVIVFAAFLEVRLDGRLVHELVGSRIAPLRSIDEYGALLDQLAMDGAVHAKYRVGQVIE